MIILDELTEAIVTCNVQFVNWVAAYNRLKSRTKIKMEIRSLIDAWMIFSARKRINVTFPVVRRKSRNLDVESGRGSKNNYLSPDILDVGIGAGVGGSFLCLYFITCFRAF